MKNGFPYVKTRGSARQVFLEERSYCWSDSLLPISIRAGGKELLEEPMRFVVWEGEDRLTFERGQTFLIQGEESCTMVCASEQERLILNVSSRIEDDGCTDIGVSVVPAGRSVAACFGQEESREKVHHLKKLWLEIPLKKEAAVYYHAHPGQDLHGGFGGDAQGAFGCAGRIPEGGFYCGFQEQIYLGCKDAGLGLFFESWKGWKTDAPEKRIQVVEKENCTVLRIRFLDGERDAWEEPERMPADLYPLSFRFGMQVTPVRAFPANPLTEKALHIDCYKKTPGDYETYLSSPVCQGEEETGFQRMKRLGVEVLYLHEKWNDIQNSMELTQESARRLRYIVEECHKLGIRVIPYFGYEISTLSPLWQRYGKRFMHMPAGGRERKWSWYRQPPQRDFGVCFGSGFADIFAEGVERLMEEYGFDGIYVDSAAALNGCVNQDHGCGFAENGQIAPTWPVWELRKAFRKLYRAVDGRGGTVQLHGCGSFNLAVMSCCHSLWEGETFQSALMSGRLKEMPEGHLQAVFTGRNTGIPVYSLCYSNPPDWTYSNALVFALLHGSFPKPNDIGDPLEETARIWKAMDRFLAEQANWKPYFGETDVEVSDGRVKVSYFETETEILAFCGSTSADFRQRVVLDFAPAGVDILRNAFTDEKLGDSSAELFFEGIGYYVLHGRKGKDGGRE